MTRGRKKNLDLPPTKSLEQQRAFRARKAQYVVDLEERCRKAEAENDLLRKEIMDLRAVLPANATLNPELFTASLDLMHHLSSTSASLARFQVLAHQNIPQPLNPSSSAITASSATSHSVPPINQPLSPNTDDGHLDSPSDFSDDPDSPNCCGGIMDCRGLFEESQIRISGLRSTSNSVPDDSHNRVEAN